MKPKTSAERHDYELACLEEVRRQISESQLLQRDGTVIHRADLEEAYPTTRLVVDAEGRGRRKSLVWQLWHEGNGDFNAPSAEGELPPPSIVARDVMVQLYEF